MKSRLKFIWHVIFVLLTLSGILATYGKIFRGEPILFIDWIGMLCMPIAIFGWLVVFGTMRITFSAEGVTLYWKIGIGPVKLWEQTNYHLNWDEISYIFSQFPVWIPFHLVGVVGHQGHVPRSFFIGSHMTHKKKSLVYIGDHAKSAVIGQDLRELIEKYRRQLQNKYKTTDYA